MPDCKAKSSKGGSVSNFMENLREGGLGCGLTMDFQFWILIKIQRGMILSYWVALLTWLTSWILSCFPDNPKISQRRFPRSENLRIETTTLVTGLQVQTARLQYPFLFAPWRRRFATGKDAGVLSWFFVRVLDSGDPFGLIIFAGSKRNHIGRHRHHPLPARVLMSQVLLVQPRTEDGQSGGVLHLGRLIFNLIYLDIFMLRDDC